MIHFLLGAATVLFFNIVSTYAPLFFLWGMQWFIRRYGREAAEEHVLNPLFESRPQKDADRTVYAAAFPGVLGRSAPMQRLFVYLAPFALPFASADAQRCYRETRPPFTTLENGQ